MTSPAFVSGAVAFFFFLIFPDAAVVWITGEDAVSCFGHLTPAFLLLQKRWGVSPCCAAECNSRDFCISFFPWQLVDMPPGTCCKPLLMVAEWVMGWFGVRQSPRRHKWWSLLSLTGPGQLACLGSRGWHAAAELEAAPTQQETPQQRSVLILSCSEGRRDHSLSCCKTLEAGWLQKALCKLWKVDPNACSRLGI